MKHAGNDEAQQAMSGQQTDAQQ